MAWDHSAGIGKKRKTTGENQKSTRGKGREWSPEMKRIALIIIVVCMAAAGICTGTADQIISGSDQQASAASYPALKTVNYKATGNQRNDIIGFAKTQIGYAEGGNNNTYFGSWFGANYNPWCAMFVCWCARKAGVSKSVIPQLATADRSWAKSQGVYHKSKQWGGNYKPKKGDLIYFSWSVRDWADHIGMVSGTGKSDGTECVFTIEGNKHDKVVTGTYALNNRYILGYASPKYTTGDPPEETEPTTTEKTTETSAEASGGSFTLKYRDGLDETSNNEEDAIIAPAKGSFGQDMTISSTKFKRKGHTYTKMNVYRENKSGKLVYLCRGGSDGATEKWYQSSKIPGDFTQVFVDCGGVLRINKKVSGTIYVSPVWEKRIYTITYDANGGANAPAPQEKTYGESVKLSTGKPDREGYTFLGWSTDSQAEKPEYTGGETYKTNKKMTLYAVWELHDYEVETTAKTTARSGPGTKYKKKKTISSGTTVTITRIKDGWGKMKNGTWLDLKYTIRTNVTKYQLNYDDGMSSTTDDASVIPPVTVSYGKALTASDASFTRTGRHYGEWKLYYKRNGKKVYLCSKKESTEEIWKHKIPSDVKLVKVKKGETLTIQSAVGDQIYITPVWERDTYKVVYKANGGKKAPTAQKKTYGKTLKLRKSKPTRKGYKFLGWSTDKNATKAKYKAGGKYKANEPARLYAVWKSTTFKVKTKEDANKRKGPGPDYAVIGTVAKGRTVTIIKKKNGWGKLKKGGWISLSLTKKVKEKKKGSANLADADGTSLASAQDSTGLIFTVRITAEEGLNARYGPGDAYDVATSYEYHEPLRINKMENGWGKLADEESDQWIMLKYTELADDFKVKITSEDINQRAKPEYDAEIPGTFAPGTYTITDIDGDWGKVKETGTWVNLAYVKQADTGQTGAGQTGTGSAGPGQTGTDRSDTGTDAE